MSYEQFINLVFNSGTNWKPTDSAVTKILYSINQEYILILECPIRAHFSYAYSHMILHSITILLPQVDIEINYFLRLHMIYYMVYMLLHGYKLSIVHQTEILTVIILQKLLIESIMIYILN